MKPAYKEKTPCLRPVSVIASKNPNMRCKEAAETTALQFFLFCFVFTFYSLFPQNQLKGTSFSFCSISASLPPLGAFMPRAPRDVPPTWGQGNLGSSTYPSGRLHREGSRMDFNTCTWRLHGLPSAFENTCPFKRTRGTGLKPINASPWEQTLSLRALKRLH